MQVRGAGPYLFPFTIKHFIGESDHFVGDLILFDDQVLDHCDYCRIIGDLPFSYLFFRVELGSDPGDLSIDDMDIDRTEALIIAACLHDQCVIDQQTFREGRVAVTVNDQIDA